MTPGLNIFQESKGMPIDPVCGKEITDTIDAAKTEYQGKLYYFDSAECKRAFEDDPRRYTSGERK